jgi:hypothetical protein
MSSVHFLDAESVSNAIARVLSVSVVEQYELVGGWVTSRISNTEKDYVTTKEIRHVSFLRVFFINQCNLRSLTISFSSDYSAGRFPLCGKVEQVFRDESGHLEGCKRIWSAAPVNLRIRALP